MTPAPRRSSKARFALDPELKAREIETHTDGGRVTLKGRVDSHEEIARAKGWPSRKMTSSRSLRRQVRAVGMSRLGRSRSSTAVLSRPRRRDGPLPHDGLFPVPHLFSNPASGHYARRLWVGSFYKLHALGIRERSGQMGRSRRPCVFLVSLEGRNDLPHLKLRHA